VLKQLTTILFLLLFAASAILAQDSTATPKKPAKFKYKKSLKIADKRLDAGNLYGAYEMYETILDKKPESYAVAWKLANVYYQARDYKKAEQWFTYLVENKADEYPQAEYWQAMMMKMNGKYFDAMPKFQSISKKYGGEDATTVKRWAKIDAEGCELALKSMDNPEHVNITHLGPGVNSPYSDISPVMWDDNTLLFATLPTDTVIIKADDGAHMIKLYQAKVTGNGYDEPVPFDKFNIAGAHVANGAFSPDKKRFYFTICKEVTVAVINCAIYLSEFKDGAWTEPIDLGPEINLAGYTNTHPSVGTYKVEGDILYFTSNRPSGRGGKDIWYSIINKNGKYSAPKNAGGKINTDRDEATPNYDPSTGTLYFSSTGHAGFGGYDIFSSTGGTSRWEDPINVGYPVNSQTDDMYYRFLPNSRKGYFVSNRPGVIALKSETCCDDIFTFEPYNVLNIGVNGFVLDEASPSTPLNGAKVSLFLSGYKGLDQDILVSEFTLADSKPYFFTLNADANYKLVGSMDGYLKGSTTVSTMGITQSDTLTADILLKRLIKDKNYSLRNIYYDYDKSDIREESKPNLDSLYQILVENPGITIELSSHTDSRGSETYNQTLSQKRAESCVNYLISKGIAKDRMVAKGYGESKPLENCTGLDGCSNESNSDDCPCHQKNRRTEFKILSDKPIEVNYEE
jgi:outer membrane protein OmpA-like peptidoglycan-associated protein